MTASEMLDLLAQQTWETTMGDVFKEASERLKAQQKMIDNYHKGIAAEKKATEKVWKAAVCQAKKAETDIERARVQAECGHGCGHGGCECGSHGCGGCGCCRCGGCGCSGHGHGTG